jgi:benzoyl-CoA reductase/2-hydroxyglutaryl-CoA dehydratase subunit BcrC/BadD/HgdB
MGTNHLTAYLTDRPEQLKKAREKGVKVIGYFPGNYVPEELIYAAGAIPICLIRGGQAAASEAGLAVLPRVICHFARAQAGERSINTDPYYGMLDMLVAPVTCQHLKKVTEVWEYQGNLEIFKLGIPQQYEHDFEVQYFIDRLRALKERLERCTGNAITDQKLREAISLYNNLRSLFKKISLMRSQAQALPSAREFVELNHISYYVDPVVMATILESTYLELQERQSKTNRDAPRILLIGPNLAHGDYTILDMVNEAGGEIVIEEVYEGVRNYWNNIATQGDALIAFAKGYLVDRLPPAFMRNSAKKRLDFNLQLIQNFKVDGVIWYQLICCETYDAESFYFSKKLEEKNIPMLILESDYSTTDRGQMKTRIQAFLEILKGVN